MYNKMLIYLFNNFKDVIDRNTVFYKYKNNKSNVNFNGNKSENCTICISKFYKNNNVR